MRSLFVAFAVLCVAVAPLRADATDIQDLVLGKPAGQIAAAKKCHNITGTCLDYGFVCANGETLPHEKRCDGVEDCGDGTDEFMCHHEDDTPMHLRTDEERHAVEQGSCIQCTCTASVHTVTQGQAWWDYAKHAPADFLGLMTGTGTYAGKTCARDCTFTILMGFYRKTGVCRGWLCCARQRECTVCYHLGGCASRSASNRCYA